MATVTNSASGSGTSKSKSKGSKAGKVINLGDLLQNFSGVNWAEEMENESRLTTVTSGSGGTQSSMTTVEQRVSLVQTRNALPTAPKAARGDTTAGPAAPQDRYRSGGGYGYSNQSGNYDQRRGYDSDAYSHRYDREQQQSQTLPYRRAGPATGEGFKNYNNAPPMHQGPVRYQQPLSYNISTVPQKPAAYYPPLPPAALNDQMSRSQTLPRNHNAYPSGPYTSRQERFNRGPDHDSMPGYESEREYSRGGLPPYGAPPHFPPRQPYPSVPPLSLADQNYPALNRQMSTSSYGDYPHDAHSGSESGGYAPQPRGYDRRGRQYGQQQAGYTKPFPAEGRYYDRPPFDRRSQPPPENYGSLRRVGQRVSTTSIASDHHEDDVKTERPKLNLMPRTKPLPDSAVITPPPADAPSVVSIFGGAKPVDTRRRDQEIEDRLLRQKQEAVSSRGAKKISISSSVEGEAETQPQKPTHHYKFIPPRQQRTISGSSARSSPIEDPRPSAQSAPANNHRPPDDPSSRPPLQPGHVTIMRRSATAPVDELPAAATTTTTVVATADDDAAEPSGNADRVAVEKEQAAAKQDLKKTERGQDVTLEEDVQSSRTDEFVEFKPSDRRSSKGSDVRSLDQRRDSSSNIRDYNDGMRYMGPRGPRRHSNYQRGRVFSRGGGGSSRSYEEGDRYSSPARSTASYGSMKTRPNYDNNNGKGNNNNNNNNNNNSNSNNADDAAAFRGRGGRGRGGNAHYNRRSSEDKRYTNNYDHDKQYRRPYPANGRGRSNFRNNVGKKEYSAPPTCEDTTTPTSDVQSKAAAPLPVSGENRASAPADVVTAGSGDVAAGPPSTSGNEVERPASLPVDQSAAKEATTSLVGQSKSATAAKPPSGGPNVKKALATKNKKGGGVEKTVASTGKQPVASEKPTTFTATNKFSILQDVND